MTEAPKTRLSEQVSKVAKQAVESKLAWDANFTIPGLILQGVSIIVEKIFFPTPTDKK